ncbi:MAG: ribosomal RNA small subunit methyltransferase A [Desulfobacca sp.]|nr:ribosomal RNA small subunit methyltransferase A [Desulfobacca sp.]
MAQNSFPPLKSLSQNFLRNETLARALVDKLPLTAAHKVVELGAGQGALTFLLSEKVSQVLAVEIDAGHSAELRQKVLESGKKNIEVIHSDLLKADWAEWGQLLKEPFFAIGNLPYHISTPILFKIIENRPILKAAYVMLQKEVADRLLGQPGQKAYGVITVLIGYYARIRPMMQLRPGSFFPKPKVSSTFVEILFRPELTPTIEDEGLFRWVVRSAFGQRRKQIKNALIADARFSVPRIAKALEENQIDPQRRGETLTIPQFVTLSNTLFEITSVVSE